jgi:hypothetical protein
MCFDSGTVLLTVRASKSSSPGVGDYASSLLAADLGNMRVVLVVEVEAGAKMLVVG